MNPLVSDSDRAAAEQFLFSRIDYERATAIPYGKRDFKLERMVRLLARLDNPHVGMNIVHIAGTKGKGSTAAMIAAVLTAAGYRTGLYTSPHLQRVEERIRIDGTEVEPDTFVQLVDRVRPIVMELDEAAAEEIPPSHGPTYFEIITAMALVHFADCRVDWAVLEVGLGGRLDSTNVCVPAVSVITSISFDHTRQLGNTLAAIAAEKAGIIKPGVPVVSGVVEEEPRTVIRQMAAQHGSRLIERGVDFDFHSGPTSTAEENTLPVCSFDFTYHLPRRQKSLPELKLLLLGEHQTANAAVALAALEELRWQGCDVDDDDIRRGLAKLRLPARVEVVAHQPFVIVDSAHNVASAAALLKTLDQYFAHRPRVLIFATTREKDARGMLQLLAPKSEAVICTRYQINPRGIPADELVELAEKFASTPVFEAATPDVAWSKACELTTKDDVIVITGSFFIAAELGTLLQHKPAWAVGKRGL